MAQAKHILILSSWYPTLEKPFVGNFVQQHANLLADEHKVTVLNVSAGEVCEVKVTNLATEKYREIQIYYPNSRNRLVKFLRELRAFKMGLKMLEQVDLVHAHVLLPKGYLFVEAKKHFNCPLIVTEHSSIFREDLQHQFGRKERTILRRTIKHVDQFIAVSEILKADIARVLTIDNCVVIGNPVNTKLFVPTQVKRASKTRFLHISTLAGIKNVKGIVDAFEQAFSQNQELTLTIISDEDFEPLKKYASQKTSSAAITFLGPLKHEETIAHYQNADFFVLNSNYETFSIVVAEAWSCGIPVISTNVGIAKDMSLDLGRNVPSHDVNTLAQTMLEVQTTDFEAGKIRKHATQFSDESILAQLNAIYAKI